MDTCEKITKHTRRLKTGTQLTAVYTVLSAGHSYTYIMPCIQSSEMPSECFPVYMYTDNNSLLPNTVHSAINNAICKVRVLLQAYLKANAANPFNLLYFFSPVHGTNQCQEDKIPCSLKQNHAYNESFPMA